MTTTEMFDRDAVEYTIEEEDTAEFVQDPCTMEELFDVISKFVSTKYCVHITTADFNNINKLRSLYWRIRSSTNMLLISDYIEDGESKYHEFHFYIFCEKVPALEYRLKDFEHVKTIVSEDTIEEVMNSWKRDGFDWDILEARQHKRCCGNGEAINIKF
jgi:hypothetical protein